MSFLIVPTTKAISDFFKDVAFQGGLTSYRNDLHVKIAGVLSGSADSGQET